MHPASLSVLGKGRKSWLTPQEKTRASHQEHGVCVWSWWLQGILWAAWGQVRKSVWEMGFLPVWVLWAPTHPTCLPPPETSVAFLISKHSQDPPSIFPLSYEETCLLTYLASSMSFCLWPVTTDLFWGNSGNRRTGDVALNSGSTKRLPCFGG